jgi:hypothetical protein
MALIEFMSSIGAMSLQVMPFRFNVSLLASQSQQPRQCCVLSVARETLAGWLAGWLARLARTRA